MRVALVLILSVAWGSPWTPPAAHTKPYSSLDRRHHPANAPAPAGNLTQPGAGAQGKNPVRPTTPPTLRAEVEALNAAMVSAFRSNPASVAKFYTDDARILGGNQTHQGREEIVSYWAQATMFSDWKLEAIEVGGSADAPWQLGRSTVTSKSGRVMETYFVGILKRQSDGSLKFYLDIYTQSTGTIRF
jgi:ketosteroid isomerase-like protein